MPKPTTKLGIEDILEDEIVFDVGSLMAHLQTLTDPRKARGVRYPLVSLLTFLILAKLGGEDGMKGMTEWVRHRATKLVQLLGLSRQSVPHQTTYERVLEALDIDEFEQKLSDFFTSQCGDDFTVNLDGKVLRGTIPEGSTQGVHLLAAYVPEQGAVLMQVEVETKANEIVAAPRLLDKLDLQGCVVTGDAMFTQRNLCQQIVQDDGDYVLPVKGNQAKLQEAIAEVFVPVPTMAGLSSGCLNHSHAHTFSIGHGRIEYRYLTVTSQLNDYLDWPHLGQVFRLQRVVQQQKTGKLSYLVVFGVTSLSEANCSPQRLLRLLRTHWHIENRLHYVRDVTLHEDACQIREPKRQRILATLNNLIIGLIRQCDFEYVPEARRFFSANCEQALQLLL